MKLHVSLDTSETERSAWQLECEKNTLLDVTKDDSSTTSNVRPKLLDLSVKTVCKWQADNNTDPVFLYGSSLMPEGQDCEQLKLLYVENHPQDTITFVEHQDQHQLVEVLNTDRFQKCLIEHEGC